jgi:hypothetical protein
METYNKRRNVWEFKDEYGLVTNAKSFKAMNGVIGQLFQILKETRFSLLT